METNTNDIKQENTPSDNSHLFGFPVRVRVETVGDMDISLPRSECLKIIDREIYTSLARAGIEVHCHYTDNS